MTAPNIKKDAKELIETLPESANWEDLMYRIYVREAIESGIADSQTDRVVDVAEIRRRFDLAD